MLHFSFLAPYDLLPRIPQSRVLYNDVKCLRAPVFRFFTIPYADDTCPTMIIHTIRVPRTHLKTAESRKVDFQFSNIYRICGLKLTFPLLDGTWQKKRRGINLYELLVYNSDCLRFFYASFGSKVVEDSFLARPFLPRRII